MAMILAIDPGPRESGWIVGDPLNPSEPVKFHGLDTNSDVLNKIIPNRADSLSEHVVIEAFEPWKRPAGHEMVETCMWIGRFIQQVVACFNVEPTLMKRRDVCYYLTGDPQARKAAIRAFMVDRYGPGTERAIGTKKRGIGPLYGLKVHEFDALALAVVLAEKMTQASGRESR